MAPLLELKHTSFSYRIDDRNVPALDDVSLQIEEGDFVAIQGPSGSGKSTLLYIMSGLLKTDQGKVLVNGTDLTALNNAELASLRNKTIGFVFQQFHLLPKTNVLDNILLPAHYPLETAVMGQPEKDRAIELATSLGLSDRLEHHPNQLSGGQQQRVAIARALMNDPKLILADEPTGNLDSKTAEQILSLLKDLNKSGKTIIIITHDKQVADHCHKTYNIRDGKLLDKTDSTDKNKPYSSVPGAAQALVAPPPSVKMLRLLRPLVPLAFSNLRRHGLRSALTMLGITIGVAALLSMITVGQFTKKTLLASYAELGVNTLMFNGYPNWEMKATDQVPAMFRGFDWERDIVSMKSVFAQVNLSSPLLFEWDAKASFGGKTVDTEVRVLGVNENALKITNRKLLYGRNFSPFHIENRDFVCIIGFEISQRLFTTIMPIGQIIQVSNDRRAYGCKVIGVLKSATSNQDWLKPNLQILVPFPIFQATSDNRWSAMLHQVLLQVKDGADIEATGRGIRAFFERKYGASGHFRVDSDTVLIAQMKKFLTLFTILLASIALIALTVGGIGIANMMLVSVSERLREIGIRKAVGATDFSVRMEFLVEAVVICGIAGLIGVLLGFVTYEAILFTASKFVSKLHFEWVLDPWALIFSLTSIVVVGVGSGLIPSLKAERLQVIDALRAE